MWSCWWLNIPMYKYMMILLMCCYFSECIKPENMRETDDVAIWAQSNIPAINEFGKYEIQIQLLNPCRILAKVYPENMKQQLDRICFAKYKKDVIQPLQTICPDIRKTKVKREVITGVIAVVSVVVAYGFGAFGMLKQQAEINAENDISFYKNTIKNTLDVEEARIKLLSNISETFHRNLTELMGHFRNISNDYRSLKKSTPEMMFETSKFAHNLAAQKQKLEKARRDWKKGIVTKSLIEAFYMNANKTSREFPLYLAQPVTCSLAQNSNLSFIIKAPAVDKDIVVLRTEKFTQLVQNGTNNDTTCELHFNGPSFALVSRKEMCILGANILFNNSSDNDRTYIQFESSKNCIFRSTNTSVTTSTGHKSTELNQNEEIDLYNSNKHRQQNYVIRNCKNTTEVEYTHYAKQAILNNQVYVYCFGLSITILRRTFKCPNKILILPFGMRFSMNPHVLKKLNMTDHLSSFVNNFSNETQQIAHDFYSVKRNVTKLLLDLTS